MKNVLSETCTSLVTSNGLTSVIHLGHCPWVHFNLPCLASFFSLCQTSWRGIPAPHTHFDLPTLTSHFAPSTVSEMAGPSTPGSPPLMHLIVSNQRWPYCHKEPDSLLTGWPYLSSLSGPASPRFPSGWGSRRGGTCRHRRLPFPTNCLPGLLRTEARQGRMRSLVTRGQAGPEVAAIIHPVAIVALSVHLPLCDLQQ